MEEHWGTKAEAIALICQQLGCDEAEAELIFEEFTEQHPDKVKEVRLQ